MDFPLLEVVWLTLVFLLGTAVGSFINVLVGRLPLEKSVLWPGSHCLSCLTPLGLMDNLPVLGWLMRRGRCRHCGAKFSSRYMWVELATGLGFVAILYLEILQNRHSIPEFTDLRHRLRFGNMPSVKDWLFFVHHALLFSLLLAAALCDWDHRAIPLSLTTVGTLVGLALATALPWPWPSDPSHAQLQYNPGALDRFGPDPSWAFHVEPGGVPEGLYPWPVWGPIPHWLQNHRWALGLLTGLAGAAMGMLLIRCIKFLFEKGLGKEALGLGDADLMMMAGAFIGWQPIIAAFFVGTLVSLPLGIYIAVTKRERALPFGPGLAVGVVLTVWAWPRLGQGLQLFMFDEVLMLVGVLIVSGGIFVASMLLRVFRISR